MVSPARELGIHLSLDGGYRGGACSYRWCVGGSSRIREACRDLNGGFRTTAFFFFDFSQAGGCSMHISGSSMSVTSWILAFPSTVYYPVFG